jgi:hypothetical protein
MRLKTWSPLTTKEVFALTDRPDAPLITSADDLLKILLGELAKFESEIHGAQTPVRGLWDLQPNRTWRPAEEDALSNSVALHLRRALGVSGIFANREVEVAKTPGAGSGRRTDILINTVRRDAHGEPFDPIAAVIEVKGCWNRGLFSALREQLVSDYMVNLQAPIGIYLVGWFDPAHWDDTDYRRGRAPRTSIADVRTQLEAQAAAVPSALHVRTVVLDIKTPGT